MTYLGSHEREEAPFVSSRCILYLESNIANIILINRQKNIRSQKNG